MADLAPIPVIDIFAGPGGLGEGFSAFEPSAGIRPFQVRLSVEKDPWAHQTLRLRSFFRQFDRQNVPEVYYDVLRQTTSLDRFPEVVGKTKELQHRWETAENEALLAELGASEAGYVEIARRIREAIRGTGGPWILIGGPPCQAYSVVGRARNKGISDYSFERDHRSTLYREYLRIIADFWPAVFVMENVKGLLSATVKNRKVFDQIVSDLQSPRAAFGRGSRTRPSQRYRIVPLVRTQGTLLPESFLPSDFIVPCEHFGIPQVRHRVILVGIREDLGDLDLSALIPTPAPSVWDVISDLPPLRSGISRRRAGDRYVDLEDGTDAWLQTIIEHTIRRAQQPERRWLKSLNNGVISDVYAEIVQTVSRLAAPPNGRGGEFIPEPPDMKSEVPLRAWYLDRRIGGVCNHEARAHMDSDLARYLFASCHARVHGVSPKLHQFPPDLQPDHDNAGTGDFDDRFRVQVAGRPATTVTSHISKDGHYFIHPDPGQCRSLTVREAARLQTFPDNYYFCGPRTSQYVQVGNAVPPFLARQIAGSVWDCLLKSGRVK